MWICLSVCTCTYANRNGVCLIHQSKDALQYVTENDTHIFFEVWNTASGSPRGMIAQPALHYKHWPCWNIVTVSKNALERQEKEDPQTRQWSDKKQLGRWQMSQNRPFLVSWTVKVRKEEMYFHIARFCYYNLSVQIVLLFIVWTSCLAYLGQTQSAGHQVEWDEEPLALQMLQSFRSPVFTQISNAYWYC